MVNPFEDVAPKPESTAPNLVKIFGEASEMAKESVLSEAVDMAKAAYAISGQAKQAQKSKNWAWLGKLQQYAVRLKNMLVEFVKKAIELAVFKLVLELCAMIMNAIVDALSKRGNQRMDITTPGVFLQNKPNTTGASGSTTGGYAPSSGNPFDYRNSAAVSPW